MAKSMMHENRKTLAFVLVAAALLGVGIWQSWPAPDTVDDVNTVFFPQFEDPLTVVKAEIADGAKPKLTVQRGEDAAWRIVRDPDQPGYPDVSDEQLAKVFNSFVDLKKLSIAGEDRGRHREFGVVDPLDDSERANGIDGLGKRITLLNADGQKLADLIVGKVDAKDADKKPDVPNPHEDPAKKKQVVFVREPTRDRVYRTELNADILSANFSDWAKPGLLELPVAKPPEDSQDPLAAAAVPSPEAKLKKIEVDDYSIDVDLKLANKQANDGFIDDLPLTLKRNAKAKLSLNDDGDKAAIAGWQVDAWDDFDAAQNMLVPRTVAPDELDTSNLDKLVEALKTLRISDAQPKPPGLAEALKKTEPFVVPRNASWMSRAIQFSLQEAGFFLTPRRPSSDFELVSHEGELTVGFNDGVVYHLRFGGLDIAGDAQKKDADQAKPDGTAGAEAPAADPSAEKKPEETKPGDATEAPSVDKVSNRFLMVSASFDPSLVDKPKLEKIPDAEPTAAAPATPATTVPGPAQTATSPAATIPTATAPAATPTTTSPATTAPASTKPAASDGPTLTAPVPVATATPAPTAKPSAAPTPSATRTPATTNNSDGCAEPNEEIDADQLAQAPAPTSTPSASATPTATGAATNPPAPAPTTSPTATAAVPSATAAPTATSTSTIPAAIPISSPPAEAKPTTPTEDKPAPLTEDQRRGIESRNRLAQEIYEDAVEAGKRRAAELNDKFANWYYVISDETYQKLNLDPKTLIRKKETPAAPAPAGADPGALFNPSINNLLQPQP